VWSTDNQQLHLPLPRAGPVLDRNWSSLTPRENYSEPSSSQTCTSRGTRGPPTGELPLPIWLPLPNIFQIFSMFLFKTCELGVVG
jgi:hypothetical protein